MEEKNVLDDYIERELELSNKRLAHILSKEKIERFHKLMDENINENQVKILNNLAKVKQ